MPRIVEIYVERLKSFGDYSNRRVGLRAILDENEDVKEVYLKLARECETLLEIQDIEAKKELLEWHIRQYEERRKELEKVREEFNKIRGELEKELQELADELRKIEKLAEERQIKFSERVLEKLRSIRRAIYGYYDP